uniref:UDP-glycosyltransferase 71E1 n=1 Tax=Tanacetum cinerariifolium TaxID=118510 RepID=A0A6L2K4I2_TANCI|nr:UDP-glycosyltransferase 71E1 [Tanacetum cinerariifolium]
MTTLELVFVPSPGAGHLPPTVELAKLLLGHDQRLSITIIILNLPHEEKQAAETPISTPRLSFIDVPNEDSSKDLLSPHTFMSAFLEHQKPKLKNIVGDITKSDSVRLVGFVVDMFCIAMIDVANEFGVPTYVYFTSSASALGLMFHLQAKRDGEEEYDVTELKDSDLMLSIPSYVKPVPAKLLPSVLFAKQGGSNMFIDLPRKYRESKGIIINTFQELENHGVEFLLKGDPNIPPVFPVGPILNLKNTKNDGKTTEIMAWLDNQPESSVVFLCFGSMGSFGEEQVKEIAVALERSEHRFLWSLRRPPSKEAMSLPKEYENFDEVLPDGFLEPWPLYAEQQINAFKLVVELGIAAEIKMDYQSNIGPGGGSNEMLVKAEEIESGIRRLMNDSDMRRNMKQMKDKSRLTVTEEQHSRFPSSIATTETLANLADLFILFDMEEVTVSIQNAIVVALSVPGDAMRRNDEGTSRGTQPQFTRMTKIESPKFGGDDARGWLYKCEQLFEIDHVLDPHMDQQVSCYIAGLQNDVEMVVRMFRPKTLAEVYHLSKVQEAAIKVNKQKYRSSLLPTPRGQVFNLEVVADSVHDYSNDSVIDHDEEVVHEEVTGEVIEFTPQISLNALNGMESFQTLRVTGHVGKQDLHILIDTRSTHNFLDVNKAKQLGCHFSNTFPLKMDIPALNMVSANLTEGIPTSIASLLTHFHDVFAIPTSLPPMREYDHNIVLKNGTEPIFSRPYRHPPTQKDAIEIIVKELLESGFIRPSQTLFSSPVVMVKKKDGTWRMCINYRKLNAQTIKDKFPIPIIEELIDELQGSNYFSKLDLRSGYHQIRMCQDDVEKTAFKIHEGHYEFLVMPFGLTNAPSTFQALMNSVFKKYLRKFILVFFDDILVYSLDLSRHVKYLELALLLLRRHTLFAKQSKCVFGSTRVEYLGHVITGARVATDDTKIEAMKHWHIPSNLKQLRGFLGLTEYYRRFIKGYALISQPLTKLLKKNAFVWTKEAQSAFVHLKEAMVNAPVLKLPDFNEPFIVETDALGEEIFMDFVEGLSNSGEKTVIMVVVDRLSKYSHFMALSHPFTAIQVAQLFLDNVYKLHGLPKITVSDRDKIFLSLFWKELFKMLHVSLHFSTAYHPQSDGQTEVVNRCLECYLRCMTGEKPKEWAKWLSLADYWYNTNFYTSINTTPFEAVYGQHPTSPILYSSGQSKVDSVDRSLAVREAIRQMLQFHLERAQSRMKAISDLHWTDRYFEVGQWVWLKLQPHRKITVRRDKYNKLIPKYYGPFQVLAKVGHMAYKLQLPSNVKIHSVFHVSQLKLFKDGTTYSKHKPFGFQPLPAASAADSEALVLVQWNAVYDAYNEVSYLILGSMTPELHRQFKNSSPYDMIRELKSMFEKQAEVESVGLILNGLTSDFVGFVGNYNMHNMRKTIGELHALFIEYEKGKGKGKGKGKDKPIYIPKPKNPKPSAKEHPTKDDAYHHCKEVGHWKMNCPVYLAELIKKKKQVGTAKNCHYAPTTTKGVVSVLRLVNNGFTQWFTDYGISVSKNNVLYFNVIYSYGIYEIDMINRVPNVNSIYTVRNKKAKHNLDFTYLWHCRLTHIRKKCIEKLQHDGLLKSTYEESFDKCVSCLSGKMTKKSFPHRTKRATDLLGIHTDVCGPLRHVSRQGASYFITFINYYSCYGYVYLLKHKHEVFEAFKVFKNEVENQLGNTTKALQSDKGGEYISQEFKDYLKACIIVQQLTPPYTPQHNRMSERRNRTLLDMVQSMMNLTILSLSFWDYALEIATCILNMVPTKKGCEAFVKRDTSDKLQQRSVKCIFVGYPKEKIEVEEHSLGDLNEPANYKAVILDPKSNKWLDAMNMEIQSMKDNQVWYLVDLPPNCKTVRSKWFFKKKTDMDGIVHTYKARLVANSYTQTFRVDYKEMFSPVADIGAIRILIAIATFYDYESWKMDVKTGFLNGYLDEDIYMVHHEGFIDPKHLKKSYLGKCFAMKDLEEAAFVLGIKIYRDRSKRLIELCQSAYMDNILKRFKMDTSKRGYIPMQEKLDLNKTQGAVDWKSSKQSTTAMSATEAEYIVASKATMKAV